MKKLNHKILLLACMGLGAQMACGEAPKGWFLAGNSPKDYQVTVDRQVLHSGSSSASLQCIAPQSRGFGTLMQESKADSFRDQRVRMSGYVRAENVHDWAGLWLRVDGPNGTPLAFDNMQQRPIKGSSDWTRYEIVLDISNQARQLAFGVLLAGTGQVWIDDLQFEVVDTSVPTTGANLEKDTRSRPGNLGFEE